MFSFKAKFLLASRSFLILLTMVYGILFSYQALAIVEAIVPPYIDPKSRSDFYKSGDTKKFQMIPYFHSLHALRNLNTNGNYFSYSEYTISQTYQRPSTYQHFNIQTTFTLEKNYHLAAMKKIGLGTQSSMSLLPIDYTHFMNVAPQQAAQQISVFPKMKILVPTREIPDEFVILGINRLGSVNGAPQNPVFEVILLDVSSQTSISDVVSFSFQLEADFNPHNSTINEIQVRHVDTLAMPLTSNEALQTLGSFFGNTVSSVDRRLGSKKSCAVTLLAADDFFGYMGNPGGIYRGAEALHRRYKNSPAPSEGPNWRTSDFDQDP